MVVESLESSATPVYNYHVIPITCDLMNKLTLSHEFFGYFILSLPDGFLLFPKLFLLVPQLFLSDPLLHQLLFPHEQHFLLSL